MNNNFNMRVGVEPSINQQEIQNKIDKQTKNIKVNTEININTQKYSKAIVQYYKDLEKQQDSFNQKNLSGYDLEINKKQEQAKLFSSQIKAQMQERISAENKVQAEAKKTAKAQQDSYNLQTGKSQLNNNVTSYLSNNTKLGKELRTELIRIQTELKDTDNVGLNNLKKQFSNVKSEANALGQTGDTVFAKLGKNTQQFLNYLGSATIIMTAINSIKKSVSELVEVDSILTEISKTSDLTASQLEKLGNAAFDSASKYGRTATDYLTSVQEMSRSGFYGEAAEQMADLSLKTQSAGDLTEELADQFILATNAAYGLGGSVQDLESILDGSNMITNRNSVSMEDLAEGMSRAGSISAQYGVQANQLASLVGTAVAATKKSGDEVGNSIKSIMVNLQNVDSSKIVSQFKKVGISMTEIVDGSEKLKDPIELIQELSKVYTSLPDGSIDKAGILTNIFGKYQANVGSAILSNMDTYKKMLQDYSEGMGSLDVESQKSADNIQGRLNTLQNQWIQFINNFFNKDAVKDSISGITNIIEGLDVVVDTLGVIPTLMIAVGSAMSIKNNGLFDVSQMVQYGEALSSTSTNIDMISASISGLSLKQAQQVLATKALTDAEKEKILVDNGWAVGEAKKAVATTVSSTAIVTATGKIKAYGVAMLATLKTQLVAVATNPFTWITIGITAITAIKSAYDKWNVTLEESREALATQVAAYNDAKSEVDSLETQLNSLYAKMNEIESLDGVTVAKDGELSKLKAQTEELEAQLTIAKEKAKLEGLKAEKKAIGLVDSTVESKYKSEDLEVEVPLSMKLDPSFNEAQWKKSFEDLPAQVTRYEELNLAMEEYNRLSSERSNILDKSSEDYKKLSLSMEDAKTYATELASGLMTDGESILGLTDKGESLNKVLNSSSVAYDKWISGVNLAMDANGEFTVSQKEANQAIVDGVSDIDESTEDKFAYVDEVMTAVDRLNEAKQKLSSGKLDTADVYDLIKDFPALATYVDVAAENFGDLAKGLNEVSQINLDDVTFQLESMLANAGDETTRQQIQAMLDIIKQLSDTSSSGNYNIKFGIDVTSPETITSSVDSILSTIKSAQEEIKEYSSLSSKSLSSLYDAFVSDSEATKALDQFSVGLISLSDLSSILSKKSSEVKDAWSEAMQANQESSTSFYDNVMMQDAELVNYLADNYDIDMDNFDTVQGLKNGIYDKFGVDLSALTAGQINDLADKYGVDVANFSKAQNEKLRMLREQINAMQKINESFASNAPTTLLSAGKDASKYADETNKKLLEEKQKAYNAEIKKEQDKLNSALSALDKVDTTSSKYTPTYAGGSSDSKKSNSSGSSKSKFSQVFDWISIKIENLKSKAQKAIDSIVNYTTAKSKNAQINIAIKAKTDEKSLLESAQKSYNKKANSVGLSKKYRDLVDNGGLKIETITNEKLADKIEEYTKWRDAAKEVGEEISTINAEIKELKLQKLDNITEYWDSKNSTTEARITKKDSAIALKEASGKTVTKSDYTYQINRQKTLKANAKAEYDAYNKQFKALMKDGTIKEGDAKWKESTAYLLELEAEINGIDEAIVGLNDSINNLAITKLENKLKSIDTSQQKIEDSISLKDANGVSASTSDYNKLISLGNDRITTLQKENTEYKAQQKGLDKTSTKYLELQDKIDANLSSISACKVEQAGWNAEIRNIKWEWLDTAISKMATVKNQLSTLSSLIRGDLVDDNGSYTSAGLTQLGLYAQQMSAARDEVALYEKAISNLKKELANGEISQSIYDEEMANYLSLQNQAILSTKEYEDAILDLKKNAIEAETEAFRKLIQARKDELAAQKESDDYNKSVQDKQKSIDILNKQIAVLGLSTDRKDIAQRLELEQQLNDKLEELTELQADHDYDTKQDALDDELKSYEKSQDDKLDALENNLYAQEQAIKESLSIVTSNYDTVLSNINSLADEYGVNLTNSITSPWESAINAAQLYKDLVADISANGILSDNVSTGGGSNISNGGTGNSVKSKVSSLLAKANGQGDGSSGLNTYIQAIKNPTTGKNYDQISYAQMAELASLLGISGVTAKNIEKDTATKNKILSALKLAGFKDGGYVGEINKVISGNGDTGIATVRTDELILDPNQSKLFKELVGGLPILNPVLKSLPNLSGISQKTNEINIHYDTLMNVEGNIDKSIDVQGMIETAFAKNNAELIRRVKR